MPVAVVSEFATPKDAVPKVRGGQVLPTDQTLTTKPSQGGIVRVQEVIAVVDHTPVSLQASEAEPE